MVRNLADGSRYPLLKPELEQVPRVPVSCWHPYIYIRKIEMIVL